MIRQRLAQGVLDEAEKGARAAGFTVARHDASPQDRVIAVRQTSMWTWA